MFTTARITHDSTTDDHGPATAVASRRVVVHPPGDPRRGEVESFIRGVYDRCYGADVREFAPMLASLRSEDGRIMAAAGYRSAAAGPLFLERYFDAPIESVLAAHADAAPARERIVEVGHLSAARAGEGRRLVRLLGPHLAALRFDWAVSTLTTELRHLFLRIGITPLALGRADPAVLGDDLARWGSYYDHSPVVLAGNLPQVVSQLARRRVPAEDR